MLNIIKKFEDYYLYLFFSIVCTYWTMTSFFTSNLIATLISSMVLNGLLFLILAKIRAAKHIAIVYYLLATTAFIFIFSSLLSIVQSNYSTDYVSWVYSKDMDTDFKIGFWLLTLFIASYVFSSTIYYFGKVTLRVPMLFIISMIPLGLHTSRIEKEINFPFIIFVIIFLLVYVDRTRNKSAKKKVSIYSTWRWYGQALVVFIGVTSLLAFAAPKFNRIPKIAYLDAALQYTVQPFLGNTQNALSSTPGSNIFNPWKLQGSSYINAISAPLGDKVLFEVQSQEPLYLVIQSWDKYDNNRWRIGNKNLESGDHFEKVKADSMRYASLITIIEKVRNSEGLIFDSSEFKETLSNPSIPQKLLKATISTKDISMESFLTPPGIVNLKRKADSTIYISYSGTVFLADNENLKENEQYTVQYLTQNLYANSLENSILTYLNRERYGDLYNMFMDSKSKSKASLTKDEQLLLQSSYSDMNIAYKNYTNLPDNLPDRITELAKEITAGKVSDYAKASAIESYFYSNDFKYDLSPNTLKDSSDYNDYFLFKSKRGSCVQFASAMVILARSVGLPARYTVGFLADEYDEETKKYLVRERDAHAFPEIYIAGYGWKVFEPTVSAEASGDNLFTLISKFTTKLKNFILTALTYAKTLPSYVQLFFIPLAIVLLFFIFKLIFKLRDKLWRKKLFRVDNSLAIEEIFYRLIKLLSKSGCSKGHSEMPTDYAIRVYKEKNIVIGEIVDLLYRSKFGDSKVTSSEVMKALQLYDGAAYQLRRKVKNKKVEAAPQI